MKICPYCKNEIKEIDYRSRRKTYCSRSCSNKDMKWKNERNPGQGRVKVK
jgi:hypothetical protein